MGDSVSVTVQWDLQVTTEAEVPQEVWAAGQDKAQEYVMASCSAASATKTRVAGTFIVGEVKGELKKRIGGITQP